MLEEYIVGMGGNSLGVNLKSEDTLFGNDQYF